MKYLVSGMFCALALAAATVHAHGSSHAAKTVFDPANIEQKNFGRAGDPGKAARVVHVTMDDKMRFTPREITVRQGEVVRFVVSNKGKILHEMVIGTRKELQEHAEMMRKYPGMEHDEAYMAHVVPGNSETLVWEFNQLGEFEFACLIPGHFEAGMAGKIRVIARQAAK